MICTVSLNPALDKYLRLPELRRGEPQEVVDVVTSAGGKAVNVSGVLRELGQDVVLIGFFGGYTGRYLLEEIAREGISVDPVHISQLTRTAFVVVEDQGVETEIVEPGAPVTVRELDSLRAKLRHAAPQADVVVLSGSVPAGCPDDIYRLLIADCGGHVPVLLDTSRAWLAAVAGAAAVPGCKPTLIKPNRREAEILLGRRLQQPEDFAAALHQWEQGGIVTPTISDGAGGLYGLHAGRVLRAVPPEVRRVNSVGSGDAAVAGFAVGLARDLAVPECLRLAAACGTANVLTRECAQVHRSDVERLLPQVQLAEVTAGVQSPT